MTRIKRRAFPIGQILFATLLIVMFWQGCAADQPATPQEMKITVDDFMAGDRLAEYTVQECIAIKDGLYLAKTTDGYLSLAVLSTTELKVGQKVTAQRYFINSPRMLAVQNFAVVK